jgi:hypothetical protein
MVATWRAFGVGRAGAADAQQIEAAARDELTQAPSGVRGQSALTLAAGAGSDFRRVKSDQAVDDPADADGIAVDHLHGAWADRFAQARRGRGERGGQNCEKARLTC